MAELAQLAERTRPVNTFPILVRPYTRIVPLRRSIRQCPRPRARRIQGQDRILCRGGQFGLREAGAGARRRVCQGSRGFELLPPSPVALPIGCRETFTLELFDVPLSRTIVKEVEKISIFVATNDERCDDLKLILCVDNKPLKRIKFSDILD